MQSKICCFTGPRFVPPEKMELFNERLKKEAMLAIGLGFTHFICGVLNESDRLFIQIIADIKPCYPVTIEVVAPHYGVIIKNAGDCASLILDYCDKIFTFSECYFLGCVTKQRRYIAEQGGLLIAVQGEKKTPGMSGIVRRAKSRKCQIHYIEI